MTDTVYIWLWFLLGVTIAALLIGAGWVLS